MKYNKTVFFLILSVTLALILLYFSRTYFIYAGIENDLSAWGVFFTVFGVLYAILLGFLLIDVLNRYGSLSETIELEINSLEDIRDFLVYLDGNKNIVVRMKKSLYGYVNSVVNKEFPAMSDLSKTIDSDTSKELYRIMETTHKIKINNESDHVALGAIVAKISDVTTFRTKRINLSNEKLPPRLKVLIMFMSIVLTLGFALMSISNVWVHVIMIVSLVTSMHLLYLVISDLDRPFAGKWIIDSTPYKKLGKKLAA